MLILFGLLPITYALGLSFVDTIEGGFYGLANYAFVFQDFRLERKLWHVIAFVAIWLTMMVLGVVVLSLMPDSLKRSTATVLRIIYFIPGAISTSALVVLWLFVLDPAVSPFQWLLHLAGYESRSDVFHSPGLPAVLAIMAFFTSSGSWIVVFGGVLSGISPEVVEAARIDGANRTQLALRIKLPMIRRSVILMALLSFAAGLQIFVEPQLMSLGGLQFSQVDWSLNQLSFQYAFRMGDFGAASAFSTLLVGFTIIIALVIVFRTSFYKIDEREPE